LTPPFWGDPGRCYPLLSIGPLSSLIGLSALPSFSSPSFLFFAIPRNFRMFSEKIILFRAACFPSWYFFLSFITPKGGPGVSPDSKVFCHGDRAFRHIFFSFFSLFSSFCKVCGASWAFFFPRSLLEQPILNGPSCALPFSDSIRPPYRGGCFGPPLFSGFFQVGWF